MVRSSPWLSSGSDGLLQQGWISAKRFDRRGVLRDTLERYGRDVDLPEKLTSTHAFAVIRHGKTANKVSDSEAMERIDPWLTKDPPKWPEVPLHRDEFAPETSTLYAQAESIVQMWYSRVVLYASFDTRRNRESVQLLERYLDGLGIEVEIRDTQYELLSARKKRELSTINELLDEGVITQSQLADLWFGTKHTLWNPRVIDLPEEYQQKLYEESYTQTIQNAADGLRQVRTEIANSPQDDDTLHLVVAYRTTLQAADIQNSLRREKEGIDLHYTWPFAECKTYGLNTTWQYVEREWEGQGLMFDRLPVEAVLRLSRIVPDMLPRNPLQANELEFHRYIYQLQWFVQECLQEGRTNIVVLLLQQDSLITRFLLSNLSSELDSGEYWAEIKRILGEYVQIVCSQSRALQIDTLEQLASYGIDESIRWTLFDAIWEDNRLSLSWLIAEYAVVARYAHEIETREKFHASSLFEVDSLTLWTANFFDIYVTSVSLSQYDLLLSTWIIENC